MEEFFPEGLGKTKRSQNKERIESLYHKDVAQIQLQAQQRIDRARASIQEYVQEQLESDGDETEVLHDICHCQQAAERLVELIRAKAKITIGRLREIRDCKLEEGML